MIKLLKCEYLKTRRRYIVLTALAITAMGLLVGTYGDYSGDSGAFMLENGWMDFLYQMPLLNAIFFPLLSIVIASRLADVEHKGAALKQLCAIEKKGKLYDAKLLYGAGIVLLSICINWVALILYGKYMGFGGEVPWRLYLLFLLFTIVPTVVIYIIQHTLSMLFKNQAVAFFAGIIGTFAGLFSLFLPQVPILRRCLPWGYYGTLQFVGMFGWTKETRYANAYFALMDIDWLFFGILTASMIVFYLIGRKLFCEKEV
ncbi:MAG TPA: ABC transporter permease [Candidatus Avimonoglobus intestinipullorum]|uniref:ABC transporter permease n=1 Tax=Candidatus Avimonoglobus intestinipullorum TaxID=2840699 RepID=A0A9D1LWC0_9FIRM|nr:ABC transporter permease [Candidatus Avimonoglobus intestinipullorum]